MNLARHRVHCGICGGEALGDSNAAAAQWFEESLVCHTDPRVCAAVLKEKRAQLEKHERELHRPGYLMKALVSSIKAAIANRLQLRKHFSFLGKVVTD